ncbi:MAG: NADH-ubiquinone oxidoreductase subunit NDUFA12 family protein [Hydrotalea sp.]|nr:NADH-ubiquinone oxidoreductase subunit NDUFA12 family protein [Hydrotalea sp.]
MANTLTKLIRLLDSRYVGTDPYGNKYYTRRKTDPWGRIKRFVIYRGKADASLLPPEYHAWMHYIVDQFPTPNYTTLNAPGAGYRQFYQKQHRANLSGSAMAYRPKRATATGDYTSWSPNKPASKKPAK